MKLNRVPVLDLSTGHLTIKTREWMGAMAEAGRYGIMQREEGFFTSTHHVEREDRVDLPPDLFHCLNFAVANDIQYMLFDMDADLQAGIPVYDETPVPCQIGDLRLACEGLDEDHDFIRPDGAEPSPVLWMDPHSKLQRMILGYEPGSVDPEMLCIEPDGQVLEDEEFFAPEGCWVTVGNASIRIGLPVDVDEPTLRISVLPKGHEDVGIIFEQMTVTFSEIEEEISKIDQVEADGMEP